MLRTEFESMTGVYPSTSMFAVIKRFYEKSSLSKEQFCEAYKSNSGHMAEWIQVYADTTDEIKKDLLNQREKSYHENC